MGPEYAPQAVWLFDQAGFQLLYDERGNVIGWYNPATGYGEIRSQTYKRYKEEDE